MAFFGSKVHFLGQILDYNIQILNKAASKKLFDFYLRRYGILVSDWYQLSANKKKSISVIYRIGQFKKWALLVYIGIGRYERKLISRTLAVVCTYTLRR